jgi:signal transduction histidine kinase
MGGIKMDRLLFVDDEIEIIKNYKKLFNSEDHGLEELASFAGNILGIDQAADQSKRDYEVITAAQGLDAINIVKENLENDTPIKVAFIDMRMPPGINGAETAKEISELDPNIEIVIVTAYSDVNLSDIVKKVGRADKLLYLKKPFDPNEVSQLAHNLTQKYNNERVKDLFIGNVSHELMTPLASIQGFSNLLLKSTNLDIDESKFAKIIVKNTNLMKDTIEDLILMASMGRKQIKLKEQDISVDELLEDLGHLAHPLVKNNPLVTLSMNSNKEGVLFYSDEQKVKQCLLNLLTNAIKFTPEGEVTITVDSKDDGVEFTISDTGIGIKEEDLKKVFDRFYRIEDVHHQVPGTGLGLSIVKEIVEQMHGTIQVESEFNTGTTFKILFPLLKKAA